MHPNSLDEEVEGDYVLSREGLKKCTSYFCCGYFEDGGYRSQVGLLFCSKRCHDNFLRELEKI